MRNREIVDRQEEKKKAFAGILRLQEDEKRMMTAEEADDLDLIAAIMNEIARHLSRISELCTETAGIINGEVIETACFCPDCSIREGCGYDEL